MTELLVGTQKGLFVLRGERGGPFEVARARSRATWSSSHPRPPDGAVLRQRDLRLLRPAAVVHRRPDRRVAAGEGTRLPRGRGASIERIWVVSRARRTACSTRAWPRRRCPRSEDDGRDLGAEPRAVGRPDPAGVEPGRRRPGAALDRPWPGDRTCSPSASPRRASGSPRTAARPGAPATRAPSPYLPEDERGRRSPSASTTCTARRAADACSCSSTAACTAATTRARPGTTSPPACRPTSGSRWSWTRPTPTARS